MPFFPTRCAVRMLRQQQISLCGPVQKRSPRYISLHIWDEITSAVPPTFPLPGTSFLRNEQLRTDLIIPYAREEPNLTAPLFILNIQPISSGVKFAWEIFIRKLPSFSSG